MAEYTAHTLEPSPGVESHYPGVVGFYAMPIMSNLNNTGDRIQTMVDQLGIPFVMADLFAQRKRTVFGYKPREANQINGDMYRDMSQRRIEFVDEQLEKFGADKRIAMGDSLGVAAVQGMQIYADSEQRFDALLLRDGWNLKAPVSTIRGLGRYAAYQINDARWSSGEPVIHDYGYSKAELPEKNETNILQKLWNVADVMRGPENYRNALRIAIMASDPEHAAAHFVCLSNGLSGDDLDIIKFQHELDSAYRTNRHSIRKIGVDTKFITTRRAGWHSQLMDPAKGAADVRTTLEML